MLREGRGESLLRPLVPEKSSRWRVLLRWTHTLPNVSDWPLTAPDLQRHGNPYLSSPGVINYPVLVECWEEGQPIPFPSICSSESFLTQFGFCCFQWLTQNRVYLCHPEVGAGGGQLLAAACVNTRLPPCCIQIKAQTVGEVLLMRVKNLDSL